MEEGDAMATIGLVLGIAAAGLLLFAIILANSVGNSIESCSQKKWVLIINYKELNRFSILNGIN